jgi:carboxyl-terminal processing protease
VKAEENLSSYSDLFDEIVNIVEENFYNPDQIIQDFPAIQDSYRMQLVNVSNKKVFSNLMNDMLGMLNASHTYYLTPEDYEYYQLGALFSKIPDIASLFQGQDVMCSWIRH